ncbi:MAG: hypothetical protein JRH07_18990 [Deltaproteobacteria bacterium]|nr:hypothetical protein [Deltaproteobacteria bacterium]
MARTKGSRKRALLFGAFLVLLGGAAWGLDRGLHLWIFTLLPLKAGLVQAVCGGLGFFAILWGLMRGGRGLKETSEAWSQSLKSLEGLLAKKEEMEKKFEGEIARMEELAHRCGLRSPDELFEKLRELDRLEERTVDLRALLARLKETKSRIVTTRSRLSDYMKKVGLEPGKTSWAETVRFYRKAGAFPRVRSERDGARQRLAQLESSFRQAETERRQTEEEIGRILGQAGITWDGDSERAIREFEEKLRRFHRFVELRDELIPKARLDQIPAETFESISSTLDKVGASMMEIEKRYPEVKSRASLPPEAPGAGSEGETEAEIERISEERRLLSSEIVNFLVRYREEVARLQREIDDCRNELEKAEFFDRAAKLAIQYLENVQRELHHRCAEFLNQKANAVVSHIMPACDSIQVNPDLSFSINHRGLRTTLDQAHVDGLLSVGARDQIYLALRLTIGQYLSASGIHLPFILDDALITSDDERFAQTMNFIIKDLTGDHQIILLTCHEKRHQWWLNQVPREYRGRVEVSRLQDRASAEQKGDVSAHRAAAGPS